MNESEANFQLPYLVGFLRWDRPSIEREEHHYKEWPPSTTIAAPTTKESCVLDKATGLFLPSPLVCQPCRLAPPRPRPRVPSPSPQGRPAEAIHHWRVDNPGVYLIDVDVLRSVVKGCRLSQADHPLPFHRHIKLLIFEARTSAPRGRRSRLRRPALKHQRNLVISCTGTRR